VSVDVPGSTERRRQVFDLPPVEIPAASPGKPMSFVVPFSRCGDDGRSCRPGDPEGARRIRPIDIL